MDFQDETPAEHWDRLFRKADAWQDGFDNGQAAGRMEARFWFLVLPFLGFILGWLVGQA